MSEWEKTNLLNKISAELSEKGIQHTYYKPGQIIYIHNVDVTAKLIAEYTATPSKKEEEKKENKSKKAKEEEE
jgi:hypothetical protein